MFNCSELCRKIGGTWWPVEDGFVCSVVCAFGNLSRSRFTRLDVTIESTELLKSATSTKLTLAFVCHFLFLFEITVLN